MGKTPIEGPAQPGLKAFLEFRAWTRAVFADTDHQIQISKVAWDAGRQWHIVRYLGVSADTNNRVPYEMITEAISRMVSIRSRRRDQITGELKPVPDDWRQTVKNAFAPMFIRAGSLEVGSGWFDLTLAMADQLYALGQDRAPAFDDFKAKYAELRAYHSSMDHDAERIVEAFEMISPHVCETCGAPGKVRGRGWLVAACHEHAPAEKTDA